MSKSYDFGKEAEKFALKYFLDNGYQLLASNYFYKKAEIDLIFLKSNQLIVVEVKARSSNFFTNPEDAVNNRKKRLLIDAANNFIEKKELKVEVRFDILALLKQKENWQINHIKNAFTSLDLQ